MNLQKMPKPQYSQKFRSVWLQNPLFKNWLSVCESTIGKIAKCKTCNKTLSNKICDLKAHANSKKHIANENVIQGTKTNTQARLNFKRNSEIDKSKIAECKLSLYIAEHGSIRNINHLTPLCKNIFPGDISENIQLKRTKCSAIIQNVLGPYFIEDLIADIGTSPYSLILDESTDIAVQKYLGTTIIYYSSTNKTIINTYLELAHLENYNAEGIVNSILKTIKKYKLELQNLKGIGTDNAAVMIGINNGVYKKLKDLVPDLVLVRCVCHSLQLAVSAAAKDFLPRNLEFLIRETYDWFARSSQRQSSYVTLYNTLNDGHNPLKITQACNTRWLSIESAVTRIHDQWLELKTHFQITRLSEKCYTAEMLYKMYSDESNYLYLCFLKPILQDLQRTNKAFEAKNADPTKLFRDLMILVQSLVQKITVPTSKFDLFKNNINDYVDDNCYLGYAFETKLVSMKADGLADESMVRQRCIDFLKRLIIEISNRLPENINVLKQIDMLSVTNTLKTVKPNLNELLKYFHYSTDNITRIENQWRQIHLLQWENIHNTVDFWTEVYNYKDSNDDNPFKDLVQLALSLLVLPYSNADVERMFSQMNIIKTKLRNKLKLPMLNAILAIREGLKRLNCSCDKFNIPTRILSKIKTNAVYDSMSIADVESEEDII